MKERNKDTYCQEHKCMTSECGCGEAPMFCMCGEPLAADDIHGTCKACIHDLNTFPLFPDEIDRFDDPDGLEDDWNDGAFESQFSHGCPESDTVKFAGTLYLEESRNYANWA